MNLPRKLLAEALGTGTLTTALTSRAMAAGGS